MNSAMALKPASGAPAVGVDALLATVEQELSAIPFIDVHTHTFMPSLGKLGLWGIDELLTYHYLEAELFRSADIKPNEYWQLAQRDKADLIWRTLFVENAPVSEATRGVIAVLDAFGLLRQAMISPMPAASLRPGKSIPISETSFVSPASVK